MELALKLEQKRQAGHEDGRQPGLLLLLLLKYQVLKQTKETCCVVVVVWVLLVKVVTPEAERWTEREKQLVLVI